MPASFPPPGPRLSPSTCDPRPTARRSKRLRACMCVVRDRARRPFAGAPSSRGRRVSSRGRRSQGLAPRSLLPARTPRPRPRAGVAGARWTADGGVRPASSSEPSGRLCACGRPGVRSGRRAPPRSAKLVWLSLRFLYGRVTVSGLSTLLPGLGFSIRTMAL